MISPAAARKLATAFPGVEEKPHFEKASFRVGGKIYATLDEARHRASLKLSETDQSVYCRIKPILATPATGAWGRQGWTVFDLDKTSTVIFREALGKAWQGLAPKNKPARKAGGEEKIQTLHPDPQKTNKQISLAKYQQIREAMLVLLKGGELTHLELMEDLHKKVKNQFEGSAHWYGETVKLDLEARNIIGRTGKKPEKYRLLKAQPATRKSAK